MKIFHNNYASPSKHNGNNNRLYVNTLQSTHSSYNNTGYIPLHLSVKLDKTEILNVYFLVRCLGCNKIAFILQKNTYFAKCLV
jgi:hypothetical protein